MAAHLKGMTDTTDSADPRALPLCCTYCENDLYINMATEGRPYMTYEVAESIECSDSRCGAAWEPNGAVRDLPLWIQYTDVYERPQR